MSTLPVRILQDKNRQPFIPFVPASAIPVAGTPYKLTDVEGILALLSKLPGFNPAKKQTLQNNSGTLIWVDIDSK